MTDLGSLLAAAINGNGVIVSEPSIDSGGTLQNLNNLIPAGSGDQIQNRGRHQRQRPDRPGTTPEWLICALLAIPTFGE